jgi:hypothetical protein
MAGSDDDVMAGSDDDVMAVFIDGNVTVADSHFTDVE